MRISGTTKGIMFSSQFRDDSIFCYLNSSYVFVILTFYFVILKPQAFFNMSSRKAERSEVYPGSRSQSQSFCSWVPDTARLATLARSSGTTEGIMFSSQFRDDNILLSSQSFLRICHSENREHFYLTSSLVCHPGNCVSNYPGSRS